MSQHRIAQVVPVFRVFGRFVTRRSLSQFESYRSLHVKMNDVMEKLSLNVLLELAK